MAMISKLTRNAAAHVTCAIARVGRKLKSENGQSITEYAIILAPIVVIGVLAVTIFREPVTNLWTNVQTQLNTI